MRGYDDAYRSVDTREFLDGGDVFDITHASAAVLLRKHNSHQPELAQLLDGREREVSLLVPLHDVRLDFALGELAHALFQLQLFFVQLEVQGSPPRTRA